MKINKYVIFNFLMLISIVFVTACAHQDALTSKLRAMPDKELVNYYHGINERIKEIENKQTLSRRSDETEHDRIMSQSVFYMGGEGQELVEKQKAARKEMNRRSLPVN
jgi:hypothetical protein